MRSVSDERGSNGVLNVPGLSALKAISKYPPAGSRATSLLGGLLRLMGTEQSKVVLPWARIAKSWPWRWIGWAATALGAPVRSSSTHCGSVDGNVLTVNFEVKLDVLPSRFNNVGSLKFNHIGASCICQRRRPSGK